MKKDKEKEIRIDYAIVNIQVSHKHIDSSVLEDRNSTKIYDFGRDSPFSYIIDSEVYDITNLKIIFWKRIPKKLILIRFISQIHLNFYVGIQLEWLYQQMGEIVERDIFEQSIDLAFSNWENPNNSLAVKYLAFQKRYKTASYKNLLINLFLFDFLHQFVIELTPKNKSLSNFKKDELKKVREVETLITQNFYRATPTVKEMATMAGMSISKFKILFEEIFKQSPHQYILDKKMLYAKTLLQSGQYNVTQVAYKLGYNHPSGFSRVYKNKFNSSPSNLS